MEEKWYDPYKKWYEPILRISVGAGVFIVSAGLGMGLAEFFSSSNIGLEKELHEADLNGNGIPEKFYVIDKRISVYEIDGRPATEYFNRAEK